MTVAGNVAGRVQLPEELFAATVSDKLLAQAVRVYMANQREGSASTKTRGEVEGSTRKIYRQKGTGRARHGAIRAPIFVGGGIVFGPKPHAFTRKFPQNMRRLALAGALTNRLHEGGVIVVEGLESLEPKTKVMAKTLENLGRGEESALVVMGENSVSVERATRNMPKVHVTSARNLHAYTVLAHQKLILSKNSLADLKKTFIR